MKNQTIITDKELLLLFNAGAEVRTIETANHISIDYGYLPGAGIGVVEINEGDPEVGNGKGIGTRILLPGQDADLVAYAAAAYIAEMLAFAEQYGVTPLSDMAKRSLDVMDCPLSRECEFEESCKGIDLPGGYFAHLDFPAKNPDTGKMQNGNLEVFESVDAADNDGERLYDEKIHKGRFHINAAMFLGHARAVQAMLDERTAPANFDPPVFIEHLCEGIGQLRLSPPAEDKAWGMREKLLKDCEHIINLYTEIRENLASEREEFPYLEAHDWASKIDKELRGYLEYIHCGDDTPYVAKKQRENT